MAIDSTIAIRRGVLALMKADAPLTAIVPAARVYPQTTPADAVFPFIRMGAPLALPLRASCLDGSDSTFAVHGFTKDRMSGTKRVETAEDYAGRLGSAIADSLDGRVITLTNGTARIQWTGSQLLMDPAEPGCFHTLQNFRVRAYTA